MKNVAFLSILICICCLHLVAQSGPAPLSSNHEPRFCSLLDPQSDQAHDVDDVKLLNTYNRQTHLIRSLHLIAMVRGKAGKEFGIGVHTQELPAVIDFVQPNLVHVTGVVPFSGSRVFEMASDGRELRLLVPIDGKKTFLVGPIDAPAQSQNARENLRPQPLINALRWQEGKLGAGSRWQGARNSGIRELTVDLPLGLTGAHTAKIDFDLLHGQVNSVATYDSAGELISKATYSNWQEVAASPSSPSQGCLPRRIDFVEAKQNYEFTLRVSQTVLNSEIPRFHFHPSPPRGIPVLRLGSSETAATH
jgi:hypothetical protein